MENEKSKTGNEAADRDIKDVPNDAEIRANRYDLPDMECVKVLKGNELGANITTISEGDVVKKVWEYWNRTVVKNKEIGNIALSKNGIRDDNKHGNEPLKRMAYAAVPEVLENGVVIDYDKNHDGRNFDTVVIAAPVEIDGIRHYVGAVVRRAEIGRKSESQRFYLHSVFAEKKASTLFVSVADIIG